jgi:hypothetical protein
MVPRMMIDAVVSSVLSFGVCAYPIGKLKRSRINVI